MTETVARYEIGYVRCLDPHGSAVAPLPDFALVPQKLVALYCAMVRTRAFDAKAIALQRTGRLGTFASSLGQEAVAVGAAERDAADDVLVPSFREHGAQLLRGVTPLELFLYWGGDERGNDFAGPREDFPDLRAGRKPRASCGGRGAGLQAAARDAGRGLHFRRRRHLERRRRRGAEYRRRLAFAGRLRGQQQSMGDFGPACGSRPRPQTLAQKAIAAGIPGEQVDGNDVIAVRAVVGGGDRARPRRRKARRSSRP